METFATERQSYARTQSPRSLSSVVTSRQYQILELRYGDARLTIREVAERLRLTDRTVVREVAEAFASIKAVGGVVIDENFGKN